MLEEFSRVESFLFIGLLVIVALLLFICLTPKSKRSHNLGRAGRSIKPDERAVRSSNTIMQASSSQLLVKDMVLDETGMVIPEMTVSQPSSDDFRKRIEQGIDSILSSGPAKAPEVGILGKLKDLDPDIKKTVLNQIGHLKKFRATYQLYRALDDPNVNMSELSKIIVTDPILTVKILKIANSAYFGMQQRVNSIGHALMIIGLLNLKTVLYQDGLLGLLRARSSAESFIIESLWEHATVTSVCASHIQGLFEGLDKGTLFTLGLLHDIGKFVMNDLPLTKESAMDPLSVSVTQFTISDEEKIYGVNHAAVGRLLFDQWGFPEQMGRIIESHHDPSIVGFDLMTPDSKDLKYLLVLFLSDQIAKLFASEDKSASPITPLSSYYHPFVQKKRFLGLVLDSSLYSEIKKAKALIKKA